LRFQLYPDETIYSACARIHFREGAISARQTTFRLFGNDNTNHIIWPTRLINLAQNLGEDPWLLLNRHTNYPYYNWVISDDRKIHFENAIFHGKGNPSLILGLNQSSHRPQLFLCPLCVKEDLEAYGEPYWHRGFKRKSQGY
jgi:hypothetical protein